MPKAVFARAVSNMTRPEKLMRAVCSSGSSYHLCIDLRVAWERKSFHFLLRCSPSSKLVLRCYGTFLAYRK